jgi:hypothetical protein
MTKLLALFPLAFALIACGGAPSNPPPVDLVPDAGEQPDGEVDAGEVPYQDPGIPPPDPSIVYPAPPYGTSPGDTIHEIKLYGYADFSDPNSSWRPIALSDFYDPNGNRGPDGAPLKVMLVNVSAVWCQVCKLEASSLQAKCDAAKDKGLVCYTAIFEDSVYEPATRNEINYWASTYGITYPIVLDRTFKWGEYFDENATPMNMFIDLKTMQILDIVMGYSDRDISLLIKCYTEGVCQ